MKFLKDPNIRHLYIKDFQKERNEQDKIEKYIKSEGRAFSKEIMLGNKESQWRASKKDLLKSNNGLLSFKEIEKRFIIEMQPKNNGYNRKFFDSFVNLLSRSKSRNYIEKRKKLEELKNFNGHFSDRDNNKKSSQLNLTSGHNSKKNIIKNQSYLTPLLKSRIFQKLKTFKYNYKSESIDFINHNLLNKNKKFGDEVELNEININNIDTENDKKKINYIFFKKKTNHKLMLPKLKLEDKKNKLNLSPNSSSYFSLSERVHNPYQKEFLRTLYFKKKNERIFKNKILGFS